MYLRGERFIQIGYEGAAAEDSIRARRVVVGSDVLTECSVARCEIRHCEQRIEVRTRHFQLHLKSLMIDGAHSELTYRSFPFRDLDRVLYDTAACYQIHRGACGLRVGKMLERVNEIIGGNGTSVAPLDAFFQMICGRKIILRPFHALGKPRHYRTVFVVHIQRAGKQRCHTSRIGVRDKLRIHCGRRRTYRYVDLRFFLFAYRRTAGQGRQHYGCHKKRA